MSLCTEYFLNSFFRDFEDLCVATQIDFEKVRLTLERYGFSPIFEDDKKSFIIKSTFDSNCYIHWLFTNCDNRYTIRVCIGDTKKTIIKEISPSDIETVIPFINIAFMLLEKAYYAYDNSEASNIYNLSHIDTISKIDKRLFEAVSDISVKYPQFSQKLLSKSKESIENKTESNDTEISSLAARVVDLMNRLNMKELLLYPLDEMGETRYILPVKDGWGSWTYLTRFALMDSGLVCHIGGHGHEMSGHKYILTIRDYRDDNWIHYTKIPTKEVLKEALLFCLKEVKSHNYSKKYPGCRIYDQNFNLKELIDSYVNTRSLEHAFAGLKIKELDLKGLAFANYDNYKYMFTNCMNLQVLSLYFGSSEITDTPKKYSEMFYKCKSLRVINLYGFNKDVIKKIKSEISRAELRDQVKINIYP